MLGMGIKHHFRRIMKKKFISISITSYCIYIAYWMIFLILPLLPWPNNTYFLNFYRVLLFSCLLAFCRSPSFLEWSIMEWRTLPMYALRFIFRDVWTMARVFGWLSLSKACRITINGENHIELGIISDNKANFPFVIFWSDGFKSSVHREHSHSLFWNKNNCSILKWYDSVVSFV